MDIAPKVSLLKQTDLMGFLDIGALKQLAENCKEITLQTNEVLFQEGSLENAMYLILSGEMIIFKGTKQVAILTSGHYFGEMSLIESKPRSASARAAGGAVLMEITEEQFNRRLLSEPKALAAIMKTLSSRIRHDLEHMANDFRKLSIFMHDIKNCLTPLGLSELCIEELIEKFQGTAPRHKPREGVEDLKRSLEVMSSARGNLVALINQSLSHARKIKIDYVKNRTPIAPLLDKTIEGLSCHKYLKSKKIKANIAGGVRDGVFNALDIMRVLQNLIINAGYVTEEDGAIEVAVKKSGENLQFSVIDKGCGIAEEIKPYLFKDTVTTKDDGNGLGLLSCKQIVEEHHQGRFWYESKAGQGTSFHFAIPIETPVSGA